MTSKSGAILTTPIMRETWQIKNDDIKLEEKIGNVSCLGTISSACYNTDVHCVYFGFMLFISDRIVQKEKYIGLQSLLANFLSGSQ